MSPSTRLTAALLLATLAGCGTNVPDPAEGFGPKPSAASGAETKGGASAKSDDTSSGAAGHAGSTLGEPPTQKKETCNGLDENYDGRVDEGCSCKPGAEQACYTGPAETRGKGTCADGKQTCKGSGEFGVWGDCVGSVLPVMDAKDGKDNDCDGEVDNDSPCEPGKDYSPEVCGNGLDDDCDGQADCVDGDCKGAPECLEVCGDGVDNDSDGQVDCADTECATTLACTKEQCHDGADNDSDGQVDCADPDCAADTKCVEKKEECSAGGTVFVNNIWYCSLGTSQYGVHLWSGLAWGQNAGCGGAFGTGGTFTAKCAGTYDVCAHVLSKAGTCEVAKVCVQVVVPTDNGTVDLPPFPGFADVTGACANSLVYAGGHTCIGVSGTTTDNFQVSKDNIACMADFVFGGSGSGSGSGGGSY